MDILVRLLFLSIVIAFTRRHYKVVREEFLTFACPKCENKRLRLLSQKGYLCLFFKWLPIFPFGSKHILSCLDCAWSQNEAEVEPGSLRRAIEPHLLTAKVNWRFPFGLLVILSIAGADIASHQFRANAAQAFLDSPKADHVFMFYPRESDFLLDKEGGMFFLSFNDYYFAYVKDVSGDEVTFRISKRSFGNDVGAHFFSGRYKDKSSFHGEDDPFLKYSYSQSKDWIKKAFKAIAVFEVK